MQPQTYTHPLPPSSHLLSLLTRHLPYSLPLLRRLQFRGQDTSSAVLLASFPPFPAEATDSERVGEKAEDERGRGEEEGRPKGKEEMKAPFEEVEAPFAVAYLDRGLWPGTQGWVFSSLEIPATPPSPLPLPPPPPPTNGDAGLATREGEKKQEEEEEAKGKPEISQILSILATFAKLSPRSSVKNEGEGKGGEEEEEEDDYITLGSVHALIRNGLLSRRPTCVRHDATGSEGPYAKFIFHVPVPPPSSSTTSSHSHSTSPLPNPSLSLTSIHPSDHAHIISRNPYVRSSSVLRNLPSLGVRDTRTEGEEGGKLVAFAFLGPDGALRTLHVEEGYRRMGLGGGVARELVEREREGKRERREKEAGEEWGHGDVAVGNAASIRLFEGVLGAKRGWDVYWMRIYLDKVV